MSALQSKLEQNLAGGILALMFVGCLVVLWPFSTALLWAAVLSFSTWPLYGRVLKLVGGRRPGCSFTVPGDGCGRRASRRDSRP